MTGTARLLTLWVCVGSVACGVSEADLSDLTDDQGEAAGEIQAGHVDAQHGAVVMVWIAGGGVCTGTLVAPNVVLTAGHCVSSPVEAVYFGTGAPLTSTEWSAAPTEGANRRRVGVIDQLHHPSYQPGSCPNVTFDVGLLRLERAVTDVRPLALATTPPAVDQSCTAVGFGTHTSGNRDELPTGTVKTGMSFSRKADAAMTGAIPSFQSPSEARTTARRFLNR